MGNMKKSKKTVKPTRTPKKARILKGEKLIAAINAQREAEWEMSLIEKYNGVLKKWFRRFISSTALQVKLDGYRLFLQRKPLAFSLKTVQRMK